MRLEFLVALEVGLDFALHLLDLLLRCFHVGLAVHPFSVRPGLEMPLVLQEPGRDPRSAWALGDLTWCSYALSIGRNLVVFSILLKVKVIHL